MGTAGPGELQEPPVPSGNAREGQDRGDEHHEGSCKGMWEGPVQSLIRIKISVLGGLLWHFWSTEFES